MHTRMHTSLMKTTDTAAVAAGKAEARGMADSVGAADLREWAARRWTEAQRAEDAGADADALRLAAGAMEAERLAA